MMNSPVIKVESLRDECESNTEWGLRRQFLEANLYKVPIDHLICLSRCYVNMTVYKCSYPYQVMIEVQEMSKGLTQKKERESPLIMAGLDFNMAKMASRKAMGIPFIKPPEMVGSLQNSSVQNELSTFDASQGDTDHGARANYSNTIPYLMSCRGTPSFSPVSDDAIVSKPTSSPYVQTFVKSGETFSSLRPNSSDPGQSKLNKGRVESDSAAQTNVSQCVTKAKPLCSIQDYFIAWKQEQDPDIAKFRKLAYEVITLKTKGQNAMETLHSAANRVPIFIEFSAHPEFGAKNNDSFLCYVFIQRVRIASGHGPNIKDAKTNAFERALQKILMPHLRIIFIDPTTKELVVSKEPFTSLPLQPSRVSHSSNQSALSKDSVEEIVSQHKESNMEAANRKRRYNEYKPLNEFIIMEPIECSKAYYILRKSADLNHMLLEYEYFFKGKATRCTLKIENVILADVSGISKASARKIASKEALLKLKKFCWIIKAKQAVDSNTKILREEMLNEGNKTSESIGCENVGNKLLRKMGWTGGGLGKNGSGIVEPVSLKSVVNREGLGLRATKGVTDEFRRKVKEVIENYAASDKLEDLVLSCDFSPGERQIIHDECSRLNLLNRTRGKRQKRHVYVSRKVSVNQLFEYLMSVGGETAQYQLVPPGQDVADAAPQTTGTAKSTGHPSSLEIKESDETSEGISHDKPLREMRGADASEGEDGFEIHEPVSPECIVDRESFGRMTKKNVTHKLKKKAQEVIEEYADSVNMEALVFSCDFTPKERKVIHQMCEPLNLLSKSKGVGPNRYLRVYKKLSIGKEMAQNQLQLALSGQVVANSTSNTIGSTKSPEYSSSLLSEALVKLQVSSLGTDSTDANGTVPFVMQESEEFSPQDRSNPNSSNTTSAAATGGACNSNVYSSVEVQASNNQRQRESSPY